MSSSATCKHLTHLIFFLYDDGCLFYGQISAPFIVLGWYIDYIVVIVLSSFRRNIEYALSQAGFIVFIITQGMLSIFCQPSLWWQTYAKTTRAAGSIRIHVTFLLGVKHRTCCSADWYDRPERRRRLLLYVRHFSIYLTFLFSILRFLFST